MTFPAITAFYAGLFGLLYVGLALWVVAGRVTMDTLIGDGGNDALTRRVRSHGNFAEYVPIALLLIALLEASGGAPTLIRTLLIVLLVARILHPIGMFAPKNSPQQFACRGGGIVATAGVILVAAADLLLQ